MPPGSGSLRTPHLLHDNSTPTKKYRKLSAIECLSYSQHNERNLPRMTLALTLLFALNLFRSLPKTR